MKKGHIAAFLVVSMSCASMSHAANFSFTGNFSQDDNVQLFGFAVGAASSVTLRTYSYAGGTQADGNVVARGGFDPILALFDSSGALIDQNDDGGFPTVPGDSGTGFSWDTYLEATLAAGNYTVAVMQYNNFAAGPNLSNGFVRQGEGNFTALLGGCAAQIFCDVSGNPTYNSRSSHWAFDILNVESAVIVDPPVIPVPAALPLFVTAIGLLGFVARRRISPAGRS